MAGDGSGRRHRGAHEMRASAGALPAFEIAIRRRCAALPRLETIVVHREAHRATRLAPFETGVAKDAVQSLRLRLRLDGTRPRHDERQPDVVGDVAPADDRGGLTQVLDA